MLELKSLKKGFGTRTVLQEVNLTIQSGEFLSLLGPSGCGKTTLLRLIAGLEQPDQGQIVLDGVDLTGLPTHKRPIHTVFQRYALFPHMNVGDNVAYGLRCKGFPEDYIKKKVDAALELVSLGAKTKSAVTTLSGGEQQRVALVRALVNEPKILLLDEPLGALDAQLRLQLQKDLMALQKQVKTTFIFVTHDQQEALTMSDRVVVLNKGRLEQVGTSQEVYEFPESYFVAQFVGNLNTFKGVASLTEKGWILKVSGIGELILPPGNFQEGQSILICIRPEKITLSQRPLSSMDTHLSGTLKSQLYLGTHTQYEVQASDGSCFHVFQQRTSNTKKREFQTGDRVTASWPSQMSRSFPETSK